MSDVLGRKQGATRAKIWWQAFRYHYVPPSIFPAVLGGLVSWANNDRFFPLYFLLVLIAVIINHIGLNMTDDYFDYKHSVDTLKPGEKNPYTGGSGILTSGGLKTRSMFKAFTLCYLLTATIGLFLTFARGLPILFFGLAGIFCAIFYTAPPIRLGHRGLGELVMLMSFGPIIGLGAFFVQAQVLTLEAFMATLPMGIMLFSMIVLNEIPDIEEDTAAGKLTLVARYGKNVGATLYVASWLCTYGIVVVSVVLRILPIFTLLAFTSLPLVWRSIRTAREKINNPLKLASANLDMIMAHSVTAFGLITGYAIKGLLNGSAPSQLLIALVSLGFAYAPAAIMLLDTSARKG